MATKKRHEPESPASSRTTLLVLAVGGLAVAALVVWALTRTVVTRTDNTASAPVTSSTPAIPAPSPLTTGSPLAATQTPPGAPFAQTAPAEDAHASVPRMSVEDLREQWKAGAVTVVDVRDDAAFAASHIPGSVHIPFARVEGEMSTLPKDKPIVLYCT